MEETVERLVRNSHHHNSLTAEPPRARMEFAAVRQLMLAVLERAVNDFQSYAAVPTTRGRRLFAEVDAWFRSSTGGPFDFETICQAIAVDPDFFREGLRFRYAARRGQPLAQHRRPVRSLSRAA